jgi:hypothetical protein
MQFRREGCLVDFHQVRSSSDIWTLEDGPDSQPNLLDSYDDENDPRLPAIHRYIEGKMRVSKKCTYCESTLEVFEHIQWDDPIEDDGLRELTPDYALLAYCEYCGFWNWYSKTWNRGWDNHAALSVLKEFEPSLPVGLSGVLARHLRQNQYLWGRLSPSGMEKLVTDIFRANFRDAEVLHVGKPGDHGVDVLFVDADSNRWLIQVKRRQSANWEPFDTVQRLLGAMVLGQSRFGIVASNADHFSYAAERAVNKAQSLGYTIQLLDRGKLTRMLGPMLPERPWESYMKTLLHKFPQEFRERLNKHRIRTEQLWLF